MDPAVREHTAEADRSPSPLPLSLIPQCQPSRPNTAFQYPVFNPELPKLQFSPSPLYAKGWSNLLRHYPGDLGSTIAGILTYGAQIGYRGKKQFCHSSNHHIHEPGMISAKLAEDLNLGRIRLASRPSFVSPLGLVPKHDGGWRRIHDLSWPPGQGLNQGIPDSWSAIEYMRIDDIYEQVTQAGPGCTIIKRDIKDALRIVPIAEGNQHLLAFRWNDSTYVECCLPFGLATAPFLFSLFAEALHWILQCLLPVFYINHYLDDFIAITRSPSVSDPTGPFDEVYNGVTDYLRIPRNSKKDEQGTCVTVLGIQIDSIAMEARLSPEKLCRATLDAAAALDAASLSLKQTESLTGLLSFCSRVVRLGRTRLQSLYTFQAAFPHGRSARRRIPYEVRDDLEWWRDSLSLFNGVLLLDPCLRTITHLYTDASSIGQGLFFFSSKSTSDCWRANCHQLHPHNAASLALAQDAHAHHSRNAAPLAVAQVAHAHHPSNAAPLAVAQDAHAHHSRNAAPLAVAQDAHAHHSRNAAPLAVAQVAHAHHPSKAAPLAVAQDAHAHHSRNAAPLAVAQDAHAHHSRNAAPLAVAQDAHAHINTNEVDAILQGFLLFSHHWLHHTLVIHTDSSTAHAGLRKGFLHGPPNAPLKSLLILAAARDIQIVPHWLPSEENALADALSRNNFQEVANICPHWQDLSVLNRPRGSLHELLSSMQAT